ncbi:MAG: tRNA (cytidine(34)-2'-O)-methyltransferase [Rhodocyclaceae bacterium]|nr:tRNA (cytidine(34)-2'-O)-methyltransferase [Rhodocyclaceae bacterium]MBX3670492.1 tRNA (cytidine(34)-2'-O)-methyltransferase [Rhodocyclaceae bacterium]
MFHIILFQPEIPPNTGNVMRLAANTGAQLHLVRPLGFQLSDRQLTRAGMDYRDRAQIQVHDDWPACAAALAGARLFALSTRGQRMYDQVCFQPGDALLFGSESAGLPPALHAGLQTEQLLTIPMRAGSRSMNLANAVSVVLYEAWRQQGFAGA